MTLDDIDNLQRAEYGRRAVRIGSPDYGQNGDDLEGYLTDGVTPSPTSCTPSRGWYPAPRTRVRAKYRSAL